MNETCPTAAPTRSRRALLTALLVGRATAMIATPTPLGFAATLPPRPPASAEEGVRASLRAYDGAWNTHDANALASLFHEDAVFMSVEGRRYHGRAVIGRHHRELFADRLSASLRVTDRVDVSPKSDGSAAVDVRWRAFNEINEDRSPRPSRSGFTRMAMRAEADGWWRILLFQATHATG